MYRTDDDTLTVDQIKDFVQSYYKDYSPKYKKLQDYYMARNQTILQKKSPDPNNPDNRTVAGYGRKIVNTYSGYGYRPRYITYKSENEAYMQQLQLTFNETNEHLKTSQHGRNTGIYGLSYELLYLDKNSMTGQADVKLGVFDPIGVFLIYDNAIEPSKKYGIRFYQVSDDGWKIEVYDNKNITYYDADWPKYSREMVLTLTDTVPHFFGDVPIIKYSMVDEIGIIEPVLSLIDDYDLLLSDSMNEFDRFSHAYLRLVGMSLSDQKKSANPNIFKSALNLIKQRRVFEQLKDKEDVSFLTKDIPTAYIQFMSELVRDQIHIQSHVPDFAKLSDLSGIAVQRLMFDFENVVSGAEAEFDTGLYERIKLITRIYNTSGRPAGTFDEITISHKRNTPLNLKEFADTAVAMKSAGFSAYLIADIMPDDIIPDVDAELERQSEERADMLPDIESIYPEVEQ